MRNGKNDSAIPYVFQAQPGTSGTSRGWTQSGHVAAQRSVGGRLQTRTTWLDPDLPELRQAAAVAFHSAYQSDAAIGPP